VFNASLREQFATEQFDPTKDSVRDFSSRLENYRAQLEGSEYELSERDVTLKLLATLPAIGHWQQAKHFAIRERQDLEGTIVLLQSYETKPTTIVTARGTDTNATANTVREADRDRNRLIKPKSTKRRRSRSRSQSESPERMCYFCEKKGHFQKDCKEYQKAKKRLRERKDDSDSDEKPRDKGKRRDERISLAIGQTDEESKAQWIEDHSSL
jgi:hypothetical protein